MVPVNCHHICEWLRSPIEVGAFLIFSSYYVLCPSMHSLLSLFTDSHKTCAIWLDCTVFECIPDVKRCTQFTSGMCGWLYYIEKEILPKVELTKSSHQIKMDLSTHSWIWDVPRLDQELFTMIKWSLIDLLGKILQHLWTSQWLTSLWASSYTALSGKLPLTIT